MMWSAIRRRFQTAAEATERVASPTPPVRGVSSEEWRILVTARPNLLLVGDRAVTRKLLRALFPALQEPVWATTGASLTLPVSLPATLIVQDATGLAHVDQVRLLQWLSGQQPGVQLVTTTPKSLLPFVLRGTFLETLYYRLNVVCLELSAVGAPKGGVIPDAADGTTRGALRRSWMVLKASLSPSADKAMISEAAHSEDLALTTYEHALEEMLPLTARDVVERQCAEIRMAHDRVRAILSH
ncbi:MAG: PA2169 family four-helix-bundle protein [Vicinamibacterales bacterium]